MAVASGNCPSCGAPIEFGLGASIAKVCEYCGATVCRTDRGLETLGKVAAIANTPSLIAVGDSGTLDGRHFEVLGRVQLDHGKGPWDEFYTSFDHGQHWGWLAYAEGHWLVTAKVEGIAVPPFASLQLEQDVALAGQSFRVSEVKTARVVSAEGELPVPERPNSIRHYVDLLGQSQAAATIDYGDNTGHYEVFTGWVVEEPRLQVTQAGPRTLHKVKTDMIKCPSCGGDVPKLSGDRTKRLGCPYCGAVSDIALQQVVAQQETALATPDIPIGSKGTFDGVEYVCIAYVKRSALFDGERFSWDEYLLFAVGVGYRWLVKDETSWMWAMPANLADIDLRHMPSRVEWGGRTFGFRNQQQARVDYVLGEVYWQVEVGETTHAMDFKSKKDVLSREEAPGEVRWSFSTTIPWPVIASAFGIPVDGPGGHFAAPAGSDESPRTQGASSLIGLIVFGVILLVFWGLFSGGTGGVIVFGGSGGYYGGK